MRRSSVLACCLLLAALLACKKKDKNEPVDGWAHLRAELFETRGVGRPGKPARASLCPLNVVDYCPQDDSFLKPIVQPILDDKAGGSMPKTRGEVDKLLLYVRGAYRKALLTPGGRKRIGELIEQRFDKPVVRVDGSEVFLDHGFVPFELHEKHGRLAPGPTKPGVWGSKDLASRLKQALDAHPKAQVIHLFANLPIVKASRTGTLGGQPDHVLFRRGGTRVVRYGKRGETRSSTRWVAELASGGLDAVSAGDLDLDTLNPCYPSKKATSSKKETCAP